MLRLASANVWEDLLGKSLYRWDKTGKGVEEVSVSQLMNGKKVVGLYFSASWCGPCRQFTPKLAQYYEKMNKKTKDALRSYGSLGIEANRSSQVTIKGCRGLLSPRMWPHRYIRSYLLFIKSKVYLIWYFLMAKMPLSTR